MDLKTLIVTQQEFSDLVGVTTRTIRTKIYEGMPSLGRKGIPFVEAFNWWMRNILGEGEGESLTDLKIEKFKIENELKRLQLLLQKGELIPRSEILQLFLERIATVKSGLLSLHRTLVPAISGKDEREVSVIVKRAVINLLNRYSSRSGVLKK